MERLTEWKDDKKLLAKTKFSGDFGSANVLSRLAEYEDADEQGLLLRLPCKVGDTVYIIAPKYRDCGREQCDSYDSEQFLKTYCKEFCPNGFKGIGVLETVVEYIEINNNDIRIMTKKGGLRNIDTIFLTKSEAEQKLKEMEM